MAFPPEIYTRLLSTPDEIILAQASETEPPVKLAS